MTALRKRPIVLVVRDGWGENPDPSQDYCNAVRIAKPVVDTALTAKYPSVHIHTSGEYVGLPAGVMGNSEVGHLNIGAGRIVEQELLRINRAIANGSFFTNPAFRKAVAHVSRTGGTLHLLGLVSDGSVHSHVEHLFALIDFAKREHLGADQLCIHAILDGRDTPQKAGIGFVDAVTHRLRESGIGHIGSIIGRYFALDRDFRWDRVRTAYQLLTKAEGREATSPAAAVQQYYDNPSSHNEVGDEFVPATTINEPAVDVRRRTIVAGDAVIFFNYRTDRTRELTKAFVLSDEEWSVVQGGGFKRGTRIANLLFVTMTEYEPGLVADYAFTTAGRMVNTLGQYLSELGLSQFRCAESEKHPHVTYFFNDNRKSCFLGELQIDIPSPKHVPTYDHLPSMSAVGVTAAVVNAIRSQLFDFMLVNYANCDMVGHTGNLDAAVRAVQTVDRCVGEVTAATLGNKGAAIITADHGNCEQMVNPSTGAPHTQHTTFDVKTIIVDDASRGLALREGGSLGDLAPTVLKLMGLPIPKEMTGKPLLLD